MAWEETDAGVYSAVSVDVSSLSGTHLLEMREAVAVSGVAGSHHVYFDNFRTYGSSGYAAAGTAVSTAIEPSPLLEWGALTYNTTTPASTSLTVDVLDASDDSVVKDPGNVSAGALLNLRIRVRKSQFQVLGKVFANGCFAGPHGADQKDSVK